jgi:hypothetical protein
MSNDEVEADPVASALHSRLQRVLGRGQSDHSPEARPDLGGDTDSTVDSDSESTSARSWIETLRRHE